ncbi:MAG: DUF2723 domain-containing protein [Phycisphaerae bacterium]|nr:DUF2723 domain-containing protein [Phycisphaerae bacterium]
MQCAKDTVEQSEPTKSGGYGRGYLAVFAAALVLYLLSMAPGIVWQDSALIQVRVLHRDLYGDMGLALSHPLYYLFAFASQYLPFAESAFKTNLVSVLFGAVTVANVFLMLRLATGRRGGAFVGAVSLAVAHTFWQHCALPETYTLTTALLSAELICMLQAVRTDNGRWLIALFFLNGLGISNHMLAILSLPCYVLMTLWLLLCCRASWSVVPWLALAWLVGAGLYLGMIVGQILGGAAVGEAISSALFGKRYAGSVLNIVPSGRQLFNSVLYLGMSFPTPTALLAIVGLSALRGKRFKLSRTTLVALTVIHLVWAIRYKVVDQYSFFIPSLVLLSVLIGLGADRLVTQYSRRLVYWFLAGAMLPVVVYVPLPRIARALEVPLGVSRSVPYRDAYDYFLHPWKTGYHGARRFAREVRDMLPPGAVLIADGTTARPIHYLQLTEHWPTGVRVYMPTELGEADGGERVIASELDDGLVYVVTPQRGYCPQWLLEKYAFSKEGLIYRVNGARQP